jgi:hypothetical protein
VPQADPKIPVVEEGLYSLLDIFAGTAAAVVEAQHALDTHLGAAYDESCMVAAHRRLYSIPRTVMDFRFGLEIDDTAGAGLLKLIPGKKNPTEREQRHAHHLHFTLDAVTGPPSPPTPLARGTTAPLPFYLSEPFFLLSPLDESILRRRLTDALRTHGSPPLWESRVPDGHGGFKSLDPKDVAAEAALIEIAGWNEESERGMVYFRCEGEPPRYLVVRVTDKSKNDSVFMLRENNPRPVAIYSLEGDHGAQLEYAPLHALTLTVRNWQRGGLPTPQVANPQGMPLRFGLQYLQAFALKMGEGYVRGLEYLSGRQPTTSPPTPTTSPPAATRRAPGTDSPFPVYYDLTDVSAELSYSVEYSSDTPRLRFDVRRTVDDETVFEDTAGNEFGAENRDKLIESRAVIHAFRVGDAPRLEVELLSPEFVLSGSARAAFMRFVDESVARIEDAFKRDEANAGAYARYLRDESARRGAVVLLAYRGKTPKEEFLAIWPGADLQTGLARDFVFTCKRDSGTNRLKDVRPLMSLGQNIAEVTVNTPSDATHEADLSEEQYQAFHNFFHAVRIWRSRMLTT